MPAELLPALFPTGDQVNFPLPKLVQTSGLTGAVTFEGPTINGIPMPGQWLLVAATREFGWQEQRLGFMSGATLVPIGDPLASFEYAIRIWENGAALLYRQLLGTLLKKPAVALPGVPAAAALGIHDPALKDIGVTSCVVLRVTPLFNPLVESGGRGPWTARIAFKEFRKPLPAIPIPNQAIPDPGAVTPSAVTQMATANAAVSTGAGALQGAAARALLGH
jgi:hypothetical protein